MFASILSTLNDSKTHIISLAFTFVRADTLGEYKSQGSLEMQVTQMAAKTHLEKPSTLICRSLTSTAALLATLSQLFQTQLGTCLGPLVY